MLMCRLTCNELHATMQVFYRRCVQVVHGRNVQMADAILLQPKALESELNNPRINRVPC